MTVAAAVRINSWNMMGNISSNRRKLDKLAQAGVIIEKPRYRKGIGARKFTISDEQLAVLAAEETENLERAGYIVGQMVPKKGLL